MQGFVFKASLIITEFSGELFSVCVTCLLLCVLFVYC